MTIGWYQLALYSGALFILFATPGPVWLALLARSMSGGFQAAWPLAFGVVVGDVLWPLLAIFGLSYLISLYSDFLIALRIAGAIMFVMMGLMLIRHAGKEIATNSALTRPGQWAGFVAGLVVIIGNPKAIFFYMAVLPNFFDFTALGPVDIALICLASLLVPLIGNLTIAAMVDRVMALLKSPNARRRINISAGALMILVGVGFLFL